MRGRGRWVKGKEHYTIYLLCVIVVDVILRHKGVPEYLQGEKKGVS